MSACFVLRVLICVHLLYLWLRTWPIFVFKYRCGPELVHGYYLVKVFTVFSQITLLCVCCAEGHIPAWLFQCLFASRPSWDDDAQLTRLIEKGGAPQADFCWWLPNKYLCDTPNVSQCHKPPCWPTIPGGLGSFHNPKRIKRGIRYTQWSKPVGVAIFLGLLLFFLTKTFIFYVFDKWSVLKERGLRPRIADVGSIHRRNCYDVFLFLPMFMFM